MSLTVDGNRGITNASWTVGTRPGSPTAGQMGYNTDIGQMEFYDGSNWRSLSSPGPIGAVTASTGAFTTLSATTPAQFDADTSVATTAFVKTALGSYSGLTAITNGQTLTASLAGQLLYSTTNTTVTLPAVSSLPTGTNYYFNNAGTAVTLTINCNGTDNGYWSGFGAPWSGITIQGGDYVVLTATGGNWSVFSGTNELAYIPQFRASLASNGYQKLPSGLIIQWVNASVTAGTAATGTFPIAWPNAVLTAATSIGNNAPTAPAYACQFISGNNWQLSVSTGVGVNVYLIAIGY